MDILKDAKKTLIYLIIAIIIVVLVFVWLIFKDVIHKSNNVVYKTDNFLVDIDPKVNRKLDIITDTNIANLKSNLVKITNNGSKDSHFKILMEPIIDHSIKIAINDNLTRELSKLKIENDKYVLYEAKLSVGYTSVNNLKFWSTDSSYKDYMYDFNIEVIEE